jgi:hypothetical protein
MRRRAKPSGSAIVASLRPTRHERKKIAAYEDVALSDSQLLDLLHDQVSIVLYPDLHRMRSLDEILGPYGAAIILFESQPNYGHWCLIFRGAGGDENLVEFFNPYGGYPDDCLRHICHNTPEFAQRTNQDKPYLSLLMLASPYRLSYNQYAFQRHGEGVRTCGRHCAARLLLRDLSLNTYKNWIVSQARKTGTDADAVVAAVTSEIRPPRFRAPA